MTNYCKVKQGADRECVGDRATIHLGLTEAISFSSCKLEFSVAKVEVLTCKIILKEETLEVGTWFKF